MTNVTGLADCGGHASFSDIHRLLLRPYRRTIVVAFSSLALEIDGDTLLLVDRLGFAVTFCVPGELSALGRFLATFSAPNGHRHFRVSGRGHVAWAHPPAFFPLFQYPTHLCPLIGFGNPFAVRMIAYSGALRVAETEFGQKSS